MDLITAPVNDLLVELEFALQIVLLKDLHIANVNTHRPCITIDFYKKHSKACITLLSHTTNVLAVIRDTHTLVLHILVPSLIAIM